MTSGAMVVVRLRALGWFYALTGGAVSRIIVAGEIGRNLRRLGFDDTEAARLALGRLR